MASGGIHNPAAYDRGDHFAGELPAVERGVSGFGKGLGGVEGPLLFGIEEGDVGEVAAGEGTASAKTEAAGWASGEEFDDAGERDAFFAMQFGEGQGQRGFKSGDAEGSALELHLLFVGRVGGMIGGDGVHGAVGERDQDGFEVGGGAQRGIHLEVAVVVADVFVGQGEVVRGDLAGDAGFGALAAADALERVGGGEMRHVQAGVGNLQRELDVALDDGGFGGGGHAAQAEAEGAGAGVHGTVLGHAGVFGVLHDGEIQFAGEQERLAHDGVVEDGLAVVGYGNGPGTLQGAEVGEDSAFTGAGGGGNGEYVDRSAALGLAEPLDPIGGINDGRGVRHGADGSKAAG